jgi:hypothetical protein
MNDPLEPLDTYISHLYDLAKSNVGLLEVWDVIDNLLQIRHDIKIPEFVMDGDAFTKAVKAAQDGE